MFVEVELVFGLTYSGWLCAGGREKEKGFAVTLFLDAEVQAGSLTAVHCPRVLCVA